MARRKMLLHFRHVGHPWPAAEKCSCIFGMSAIHGQPPKKCSCIFGMSAIHGQPPKNAPAFSACRPSMAAKKKDGGQSARRLY
jgi:hypothetical protein